MDFKQRFVLLRSGKVKSEVIERLCPVLRTNNIELSSVEKVAWAYFILDMKEHRVVAKFQRLMSFNNIENLDPKSGYKGLKTTFLKSYFYNYRSDNTDYTKYKTQDFFTNCGNSKNIDTFYEYKGDWIIAIQKNKFAINKNMFLDFQRYFERKEKINRLLSNI